MKRLITKIILYVLALTVFTSTNLFSAEPVVTVQLEHQIHEFSERPRLSEVLAHLPAETARYWPSSKLFLLDTADVSEQLALFSSMSTSLLRSEKENMQVVIAQLVNAISAWQFAKRIPITIDQDLVRVQRRFNPRFDSGNYKLVVSSRPTEIQFWGAIGQAKTISHQGSKSVSFYHKQLSLSSVADSSYVIVVQPNGEVLKVGVQLWNHTHYELMPGAQVIIPFKTGLFAKSLAEFNQLLVSLAVNRVY
ncbi:capsule biosynthesis GfcC family protein [Rheinheimera sp. UJ63]|uniref:capsule biosynthesis GfcC family protein n=1 Tax=Rheinheimera sp. UJ63 TaxID=2910157 RepID=UPI001F2864D9|nr:capsule biosynthesis GfcC family protein [Rheinheimera sp. UJ63]MCF4009307.1 capsule biosynthesis GfcC family protein [Rheinheimera sp. UJ63]